MERFRVFLSALSVWPRSASRAIELAHQYGFDGIELFLDQYTRRNILENVQRAKFRYALDVTLHQYWTRSESPSLQNVLLELLGYTIPGAYTLRSHLTDVNCPTVIFADRAHEAIQLNGSHACWWQTFGTPCPQKAAVPYDEFVALVKQHNASVVFDTQHVLEYMAGVHGVGNLPESPSELFSRLAKAWEDLGSHVVEIHFNDFDPSLGNRGRNVFPGKGKLALGEFCKMVRAAKWRGNIIPEVAPMYLLNVSDGLPRMRAAVNEFWSL